MAKTQADIVEEDQGVKEKVRTEKVAVPGVQNLHTKPTDEIASVLTNILKSRPNIQAVNYEIGKYIEITYESLT